MYSNNVTQNKITVKKLLQIEKFKQIPEDFKRFNNFVLWESVPDPDGKKPRKVPKNLRDFGPSGAAEKNKSTWADYKMALAGYSNFEQAAGIGFVLDEATMVRNLIAIDLDHVLDPKTGEVAEWAREILDTFDGSYQETSVSGNGFHIFVYADWPADDNKFAYKGTELEVYRRDRYFALTGNIYQGRAKIATYSDEVIGLITKYFPKREPKARQMDSDEFSLDYDQTMSMLKKNQKSWELFHGVIPDDAEYLGDDGKIDQSRADYSLACRIAFYTRDEDTIEKIMRESKLYREKWDTHPSYLRDFTIANAIEATTEIYIPLTARIEKAKEVAHGLTELTTESVFTDTTIEVLAVLKRYCPAEYVRFEDKIRKAKLGLRNFQAVVNAVKLPWATAQAREEDESEKFSLPVDLFIPSGWRISKKGLSSTGDRGSQLICPEIVIITRKQTCIDMDIIKYTLSWCVGNKWKEITVPGSVAFDARKLVALADYGFPASSENCRQLARWLKDLESANKSIPTVQAVSQLGWISDGKFAPIDDIRIDAGDGSESYLAAYTTKGNFEAWREKATKIRNKYPLARVALNVAFAAPLLKLVGARTFLLHLWGASRGGKTAAAKLAASVWGCPDGLLTSFNATAVGLERLAALYNDLPLVIDERQIVNNKQGYTDGLTYMLGNGRGKLRGSKQGLQQTKTWRTIGLTTGEQPLSGDATTGGVKTRTLELSGLPIADEKAARDVHDWTADHYGYAGPAFIKFVKDVEDAKDYFKAYRCRVEEAFPEAAASHTEALAVLAIADVLASLSVFNMGREVAEAAADEWLLEVAKQLETAEEMTDAARAGDFVKNWIARNNRHFQEDAQEPWGVVRDPKTICVLTDMLDRALTEAGFVASKLRNELADSGFLHSYEEGGKRRFTFQQRLNGPRVRVYRVCVDG